MVLGLEGLGLRDAALKACWVIVVACFCSGKRLGTLESGFQIVYKKMACALLFIQIIVCELCSSFLASSA